jgi:uncharacterized protein involved in exopolysaccharide biosynthesis
MAQLQERRDTPTITVLDNARPVFDPIWPRKKWIVLTAFALTFIVTATFVVVREQSRDSQTALARFVVPLRGIWQQIRHKPLG